MAIKEFEEFNVVEHRGQRAYAPKDYSFYKIVWRKGNCINRMNQHIKEPDKGAGYLSKLYDWMNAQTDKLHQEWAQDCIKVMEAAYDEVSKPKPNLFGGAAK